MTSAANNQGFGPNWSNPNWGPGSADQRGPWGGHYWGFLPPWLPPPAAKGLLIAAMILGFVFCWPIGLVLLGVLIWSRRACGWHYGAWQARGPAGGGTGPWRGGWQRWGAAGGGTPPSSGNRAFDEYRAETLKRLEDEQKEFAEFLDRLRFAKDKAEFDQFMNARRSRPAEPPPAPEQPPQG